MAYELQVTIQPSPSLLRDICITAVESVDNTWANVAKYKHQESHADCCKRLGLDPSIILSWGTDPYREALPFPVVILEPSEDPNDFPRTDITADIIADGLESLVSHLSGAADEQQLLRQNIIKAIVNDDAGGLDADACDMILQYGMFSQLVYT